MHMNVLIMADTRSLMVETWGGEHVHAHCICEVIHMCHSYVSMPNHSDREMTISIDSYEFEQYQNIVQIDYYEIIQKIHQYVVYEILKCERFVDKFKRHD